jgi:hypothetical protein
MRRRLFTNLASLALLWLFNLSVFAQVSTYNFSQSSGTYVPITGGTVLATATSAVTQDDAIFNATIPFGFIFDGAAQTEVRVTTNGFLTFGTTSPGTTNYTPLSSGTAYAGAVSPFGRDLQGGYSTAVTRVSGSSEITVSNVGPITVGSQIADFSGFPTGTTVAAIAGNTLTMSAAATSSATNSGTAFYGPWSQIRVETLGTAPNQVFVVQWSNWRRLGTTLTTTQDMVLNFQVRLYQADNSIEIVYGNCSPGLTTFTTTNQVGLRGATNAFPANVSNRLNVKGTNDNWLNSNPGTANTSGMLFNNVAPANVIGNGLTYRWAPPACSAPSGLATSGVTGNSVTLNWNLGAAPPAWNIEWGAPGFTPGTGSALGSQVISGSPTTSITGLTPSTTYQAYVQSDCGVDGQSTWAGPISFTTLQIPVSSFPWNEGFETLPVQWTFVNGAQVNQWHVGAATSNGGTNSLYISNTAGSTNAYATGSTSRVHAYRDIAFPAVGQASLSFDWKGIGENTYDDMRAWIVPSTFTPVAGTAITTASDRIALTGFLSGQASWITFNGTIPASFAGTTARLVFEWRNDSFGGTQPPVAVDNVQITVNPCVSVSALTLAGLTSTSANVSWTAGSTETSWNIQWGAPGFTPGTGNQLGAAVSGTNTYSITGLTPETNYQVYVQADCDADGVSSWTGPLNVLTGYCQPSSTSQASWISNFTTTNAISNITHTAAAGATGGYLNLSATEIVQNYVGNPTNISLTAGGPTVGFAVWVDWNNNLVFEPSERMFNTTGFITTTNGVINIPVATAPGVYRMRIVTDWNNSNPTNPCAVISRGEYKDFGFEVLSLPVSPVLSQDPTAPTCTDGTEITAAGSPEADVVWYWQTSSAGTSTANAYTGPLTVFANGTYFIRAYHTVYDYWAPAESITISNFPLAGTAPTPVAAQNPACLPGTEITVSASTGDEVYYWQTIENGTSTANNAATPWTITATGTYYVAVFNTITQCWSATESITVTVDTEIPGAPIVTNSVLNVCEGTASVELEAAPPVAMISGQSCQVTATASGTDASGVTATVSNFSCATGEVTSATMNASIFSASGTSWCPQWYNYSIFVNGNLVAANQCNVTGFDLTPYLPLTSVSIVSADTDNFSDAMTMNLAVTLNYDVVLDPQPAYVLTWTDAASNGNVLGTGSPLQAVGTSLMTTAAEGSYEFYVAAVLGGCTGATELVTVNVSQVNAALIAVDNTCNGGQQGSFTLGTVECGIEPFEYSVNGGAFGAIPADLTAGAHTVVIMDALGNESGPITVTITEPSAPDNLVVTVVDFETIDVSWTVYGSETQWNLEYGPVGFTPGTGVSTTVFGTPTTLSGLSANTAYHIYLQTNCAPGNSGWFGPVAFTTPQQPVTVFPWLEGFETGGTQWTIVNGTQVNQWIVGSAVNNGGTQALYVTNDGGVSNAYNGSVTSVVHAYRDIILPAGVADATLSFDWRSVGETTTFDRMRVWLAPATFVPVSGTQIVAAGAAPTGIVQVGLPNYNGQPNWTLANISIPQAYIGQSFRVVFEWRNDGSIANQPPAAVDNVKITLGYCPAPTNILVSNITTNSADLVWTENGVATEWEVEYGPVGFAPGTGTVVVANAIPFQLTGLDNSTQYQVYVRANCGSDDEYSIWTGPVGFTTDFTCGGTFFDNGGLTGNYLPNSNQVTTICPETPGDYVIVAFTSFNVQATNDGLYIFDGDDITDPMIPSANPAGTGALTAPGAYWGTNLPGTFESSHPSGCLTFQFISNATVQNAGWAADITCLPCTPPAGEDGYLDVCRLDGSIDLNDVITAGVDYGTWSFPANPSMLTGSTLNVLGLPSGTFEAYYVVVSPCTNDTTTAFITVFPPSSAGNSGVISTCNFGPMNLFDGLSGNVDLGGTWYDPAGNALPGALVVFNGQIAANYNYYYVTSNGVCDADTSFVEVQLQNCASVIENELQGFELYPNPTSDVVFVQYAGAPMLANFMLTDTKGAVIFAEKKNISVESVYEMDLSKLERGVYFLNIFGAEGSKVIKVVRN